MTQPTPTTRSQVRRQVWWAVACTLPLALAAVLLVLAVDVDGNVNDALGAELKALVTGADSPGAHIASMPLLWLCRVLFVTSLVFDVLYIRSVFKRPRPTVDAD